MWDVPKEGDEKQSGFYFYRMLLPFYDLNLAIHLCIIYKNLVLRQENLIFETLFCYVTELSWYTANFVIAVRGCDRLKS